MRPFNDPNVFGAFLILPAMLALQRVLNGRFADAARASLLLGLIAIAVLLTFSRAAWGQFALTAALLLFLTFVTSRSPNERMRIVLIAIAGVVVMALVFMALLVDRARGGPVQGAREPRSVLRRRAARPLRPLHPRRGACARPAVRHRSAAIPQVFLEDPHNTYLNAFISGGWLSGFVYLTMVATTVVAGLSPCLPAHALAGDLHRGLLRLHRNRGRKRHHRQRPLAPLLPVARRDLGTDGGIALGAARFAAAGARPCACAPGSVAIATAERSAARLAHQSGGLGVPSSNLGAPTNP